MQLDTPTMESSKNSGSMHLKECSKEMQITSNNSVLKASMYVFIFFQCCIHNEMF